MDTHPQSGGSSPPNVANQAFQQLLDLIPGAWFFARIDGTFAYVNRAACVALGYTPQQLRAARIFDIDPTIEPAGWAMLWGEHGPRENLILRTRHRRRDGSEYPVEVRAARVLIEGEDLAASYTVDLTVAERTREALEQTEARLSRLLGHLPDLVFTVAFRPRPRFEFLSPSVTALLGVAGEPLLGDPDGLEQLVHPEDWARFLSLPDVPQDVDVTVRFRHALGHPVWLAIRAARLGAEGDEALRLEGVARDVSRTHEVEVTNRRLVAALDHAAEAVIVTDVSGRVQFVNPAYSRVTGHGAGEVQGRLWADLEIAGQVAVRSALDAVLADGVAWSGRFEAVDGAGRGVTEEATASPIRDEAGEVVGCVVIQRDITAQLDLERQLRHAQKMEAVGQLAGSVAHDFNNLLQVINGNATLLPLCQTPAEIQRAAQEIATAGAQAAQLVRRLLDFSRQDSAEFSPLDLVPVVGSMVELLRRLLGERIELEWIPQVQSAPVFGNAAQLEQVMMNLCLNARDAMPNGGRLALLLESVGCGARLGDRAGAGDGGCFRLSVSDTGAGIAPELRDRIFEPFFTTKAPGKGTGLGLATAYTVAKRHGGQLEVTSEVGRGSTFVLVLPERREAPATTAAPTGSLADLGRGRLVLVAEDEPSVRDLTARFLEEAGFRVVAVGDGVDALAELGRRGAEYVAAVIDVVMPRCNGAEVLRQMRTVGLDLPVLVVTGYDYAALPVASDVRVARLAKPFARETLLECLAALLRANGRM